MRRSILFTLLIVFANTIVADAAVYSIPHSVSQRNFIHTSRYFWDKGRVFPRSPSLPASEPDSIRVLALLVQFQPDQDDRTTGDGWFDLSEPGEPIIDSPPHHRPYFQNQLTALSNYYYAVSRGQLVIHYEVHPEVFTLSREMGYYNPGTTDEAVNKGLAELFRDAVLIADSAGVLFSKFDAYIVFHAGVGRDIDLGYDATPKDIPSAFLNLNDLKDQLDDLTPEGIGVEGGTYHIQEGIILPETESQEEIEIGLLGTTVLMFGFQLGLPALWDTQTGNSGIGRWGLMDQGSGNYNGLIPAEPCAFSKVFLGWEAPIEIKDGINLKVACSQARHSERIYKVPINDQEYFLIENRIYDVNKDGVTLGWDADGKQVTFGSYGQIEISEKVGVIVRIDEYDYGLPGSGLLIWHIDERIILENLVPNRVNADKQHRGVDLEEADGAQDIGESYGFIDPGAGAEAGVLHDAWFADNDIHMLVNGSEQVAFTPDSYPNSRSYSGANSHIVISGFSESDTVMIFSVSSDLIHAGFPVFFGHYLTPLPPLYGDIDGDGETEIVLTTKEGKIFAWEQNGEAVVESDARSERIFLNGDLHEVPVALLIDVESGFTTDPIIAPGHGNISDVIITSNETGEVQGWRVENGSVVLSPYYQSMDDEITTIHYIRDNLIMGTSQGRVMGFDLSEDSMWEQDIVHGSVIGICEVDYGSESHLAVTTDEAYLCFLTIKGEQIWNHLTEPEVALGPPVSAFLSGDQGAIILALGGDSGYLYNTAGELFSQFELNNDHDDVASSVLGDIDRDGYMEIMMISDGQIQGFNHNGSKIDHFPVPFYHREIGLSPPVLGDVDGEGHVDLVVSTTQGNIEAYQYDGTRVDGFPLSVGGTIAVSPALFDLDNDGRIELAAVSGEGSLYIWDLAGEFSNDAVPWGSYLRDPQHTGRNAQQLQLTPSTQEFFPSRSAYNYPNPNIDDYTVIRYHLEQPAEVQIKIFDLAGELIEELNGPGLGPADNEVIWPLENIDSGTYFCQIRATGQQEDKVVTIKIAVVK